MSGARQATVKLLVMLLFKENYCCSNKANKIIDQAFLKRPNKFISDKFRCQKKINKLYQSVDQKKKKRTWSIEKNFFFILAQLVEGLFVIKKGEPALQAWATRSNEGSNWDHLTWLNISNSEPVLAKLLPRQCVSLLLSFSLNLAAYCAWI